MRKECWLPSRMKSRSPRSDLEGLLDLSPRQSPSAVLRKPGDDPELEVLVQRACLLLIPEIVQQNCKRALRRSAFAVSPGDSGRRVIDDVLPFLQRIRSFAGLEYLYVADVPGLVAFVSDLFRIRAVRRI